MRGSVKIRAYATNERLEAMVDLMKRLSGNWGLFGMGSLLARLLDEVGSGERDWGVATMDRHPHSTIEAPDPSPISFHQFLLSQLYLEDRVKSTAECIFETGSRTRCQARQHRHWIMVTFARSAQALHSARRGSGISRGPDVSFLAPILPGLTALRLLVRIEGDKEHSGVTFRTATADASKTLVFFAGPRYRFGCYNDRPWGSEVKIQESSVFLFSLSKQRRYPLNEQLTAWTQAPLENQGPCLGCGLTRQWADQRTIVG